MKKTITLLAMVLFSSIALAQNHPGVNVGNNSFLVNDTDGTLQLRQGSSDSWRSALKVSSSFLDINNGSLFTSGVRLYGNFLSSGTLFTINSTEDTQLTLRSTDSWAGITFHDNYDPAAIQPSGSRDFLWFNGQYKTFSFGGGGSNVGGKKLHIEGGTSIGASYRTLTVPTNGLAIEGNVGIGTTDTQGYELGVNGKIAALEVKVAAYNDWPDYVFTKEYKLPTLEEVEQHIKEKGHLPNIPSAAKVKKEGGFSLGEMNKKLLEKVEQLMLYTIQQEKRIKALEAKLAKKKE